MDNPEIEFVTDLGPSSDAASEMEITNNLIQTIGAS